VVLQKRLAPKIQESSELPAEVKTLVGCDAAYFRGTTAAAAVNVDYESLKPMKMTSLKEKTRFPYIPGLLAFREGPAVVRAVRGLRPNSYVCLVDAHGRAHPRKFGLACYVGLALDGPTIGVAKSLLYGRVENDGVVDRDGHRIAAILNLPGTRKQVYVSIGHKVSLEDAVTIVKRCLTPKGPVPITLAHEEVSRLKCQLSKSNPAS